jgi:hypothetical protein
MSTLGGKLELRNKDKYFGETTNIMNLNSTNVCKTEEDLMSFYTNSVAYLIKYFSFRDESYLKHVDRSAVKYEKPRKIVAMLRFQPLVIMSELYEVLITVEHRIPSMMQVAGVQDVRLGKKWVKAYSYQQVPLSNIIIYCSILDYSSCK